MGIKTELGKKIKNLRIKKGYTQEKLAEMTEISQRALSCIELGENFVTAETFDKLTTALEITAEELFATNSEKNADELLKMINKNLSLIGDNSHSLEIVYNITKSLTRR